MSKRRVVLYTRVGCHLCDEAKAVIRSVDCQSEFELEEVDIDHDAALKQRYTNDIPVIEIDGVEAFRHRVTAQAFKKKIKDPS
jgi:glutaredoxin